jgi:hypothetical protein
MFFCFSEPFRPRMTSKFAEMLIYSKNVNFFKMQYGFKKTQNLMLISNLLKKLQKNQCGESVQRQNDRKMKFLTFVTVFSACNFFM